MFIWQDLARELYLKAFFADCKHLFLRTFVPNIFFHCSVWNCWWELSQVQDRTSGSFKEGFEIYNQQSLNLDNGITASHNHSSSQSPPRRHWNTAARPEVDKNLLSFRIATLVNLNPNSITWDDLLFCSRIIQDLALCGCKGKFHSFDMSLILLCLHS